MPHRSPAPRRSISAPSRLVAGQYDAALVRYVFAVALRYVRDQDAAWDVTQDALLSLFRYQHAFRGDSAYSTWVYRVAGTAALMHLRRAGRRSREVPASAGRDDAPTALDLAASPTPDPEHALADAEVCGQVLARVDALGERYGNVFRLRYGEGYSETEITTALDASLPAVKTRAHRALVAARTLARAA